jgi:hypothetical protein
LTASALIYLLAKLPSIWQASQHCIEFYLWLFLKVSRKYPSHLLELLAAGAVFFGFKVAGALLAIDYKSTGLLGRAALAPPAIGTDFSIAYRLPCY